MAPFHDCWVECVNENGEEEAEGGDGHDDRVEKLLPRFWFLDVHPFQLEVFILAG